MQLYYSTTSPFVRKVRVMAIETGLEDRIELLATNPWQGEENLLADNPLSKIPTLITDQGQVIYDSPVICEYLDSLHTAEKIIPQESDARWQVLRLQALADGILDAAILRFMEHKRSATQQSADWDSLQQRAVLRGLSYLERLVNNWDNALTIGKISVACALGYLDFRFAQEAWRERQPQLSAWYAEFSQRPSMQKTIPYE